MSLITVTLVLHGASVVRVGALQSRDRAPATQLKTHHPHLSARQLAAPAIWKHGAHEYASGLTWSPDGRWATYKLTEGDYPLEHERISLCSIRADGTGARRLYSKDRDVEIAGWSPNGQRVLFWTRHPHSGSVNADGSPLYDVPVHGGELRLLTIPFHSQNGDMDDFMMRGRDHRDYSPERLDRRDFSPDGRSLLLVVGGGRHPLHNKRLSLLNYSSVKRWWLTGIDMAVQGAQWAPNGTRIVFLACPDRGFVSGEEDSVWRDQHTHLWVIDASGRHLRRLTSDNRYQELDMDWLPASRIIRFTRMENTAADNGKESHWEINADGTGLRRIDPIKAETGGRAWTASR